MEASYYRGEEELRKNPLDLGPTEWNGYFEHILYSQDSWPRAAAVLEAADGGDFAPFVADYAAFFGEARPAAGLPASALDTDVYNAVTCQDGPWPRDYAQWRSEAIALDLVAPFSAWSVLLNNLACLSWPIEGAQSPVNGLTAPPLLLARTTVDPATPYGNALRVRTQFPKSVLVADTGTVGHTATAQRNPCIDGVVNAYLRTGALPPRLAGAGPDIECHGLAAPEPQAADAAQATDDPPAIATFRSWRW